MGIVQKMASNAILTEAIRLQKMGVSLVPTKLSKKPAIRWRPYQNSPADLHQIEDWFDGRDDLGLAIVLGTVSGDLVARDFDDPDALQRWADEYPTLAQSLPCVETHRGRHVYARIADCPSRTFNDGELRSDRHFVVAPPSAHSAGTKYRWLRAFDCLTDVPLLKIGETGFDRDWTASKTFTDPAESRSVGSVNAVISITLPLSFGQRNRCLFKFARMIKTYCPRLTLAELRPIVSDWHAAALPNIRTTCPDETWADFVRAFSRIDEMRLSDATSLAMAAADSKPLPLDAERYASRNNRRLLALCRELSRRSKDGAFYLSCRKAASVLANGNHLSCSRSLAMFCADGILVATTRGGPQNMRATRYRWAGAEAEGGVLRVLLRGYPHRGS